MSFESIHRVIGVDVGGTKIDAVLMDADGTIHADVMRPTDAADGANAVIDRIADMIETLTHQSTKPVHAVGVGCTGIVDQTAGVVEMSVHLRWKNVELRDEIARRLSFKSTIIIENDLKAAITGESVFGAGVGARSLVYLSIGTGLGAAALVDGHVVAMEIGHYRLYPDDNGRACTCGQHGCIETVLSGSGLARGANMTADAMLSAARGGDVVGLRMIDEARDGLARTIALCAGMFQPQRIIVGGGFGLAAWDLITNGIITQARGWILPALVESITLHRPGCPRQALGAGALTLKSTNI